MYEYLHRQEEVIERPRTDGGEPSDSGAGKLAPGPLASEPPFHPSLGFWKEQRIPHKKLHFKKQSMNTLIV